VLFDLNDKQMIQVPHREDFDRLLKQLGPRRVEEVRGDLHQRIFNYPPDLKTGLRVINSSWWGSELEPWPAPLDHLYLVARELEGCTHDQELSDDAEKAIQAKAALCWGLFLWEAMIDRPEKWRFCSTEGVLGKTYFEFE
jgi:hypothetical protein